MSAIVLALMVPHFMPIQLFSDLWWITIKPAAVDTAVSFACG